MTRKTSTQQFISQCNVQLSNQLTNYVNTTQTNAYNTVYTRQIKTRGWALNSVHNPRQQLDYLFALCDTVTF